MKLNAFEISIRLAAMEHIHHLDISTETQTANYRLTQMPSHQQRFIGGCVYIAHLNGYRQYTAVLLLLALAIYGQLYCPCVSDRLCSQKRYEDIVCMCVRVCAFHACLSLTQHTYACVTELGKQKWKEKEQSRK